MGGGIVWDWPNGRLIIDTPTFKAYVGKVAGIYRFDDGISLASAGRPSVTYAMISNDGKPLVGEDAREQVYITAVGDAQNKGFEFDWSVRGGPRKHARAVIQRGHAPVMVDPVASCAGRELAG